MNQLRDYQKECVNTVFDYYGNGGRDNGIIAMPTGTGKSWILAELIRRLLTEWPSLRIAKVVSFEEVLEQNADKMWKLWPKCPLGLYHAGLRKRELGLPVIFAGIQSVYKKAELFGHIDVLFIDEAHLVPDKATAMFQQYIAGLKRINPNMIIIGLSATHYRLGMGYLTEGDTFNKVLVDLTTPECIQRFIAEGYMAPLVGRRPKFQIDVSGVKIQAGELCGSELEELVDKESITRAIIQDALVVMQDRKSILVFGTGNKHVEHMAEMLCYAGEKATFVHSKVPKAQRRDNIAAFKAGEYRWMVNQNILLTGFDHPPVDGIVDGAPTISVGRHIQKLGRGTRPYTDPVTGYVKLNTYYADYSGNRLRCGAFDNPRIPNKKGDGNGGAMPEKVCEACMEYNHISATHCKHCGEAFQIKSKLHETAADQDIIESGAPIIEFFDVKNVYYQEYFPKGKTYPTLKITYVCPASKVNFVEYISIENPSQRAKYTAGQQWLRRGGDPIPTTVKEALSRLAEIRKPSRIKVWLNSTPYPNNILAIEF